MATVPHPIGRSPGLLRRRFMSYSRLVDQAQSMILRNSKSLEFTAEIGQDCTIRRVPRTLMATNMAGRASPANLVALEQPLPSNQTPQTQPVKSTANLLEVVIDFTRPDGQRTRPLIAEGRSVYVCDHYIGTWSPVLRSFIVECPSRELILPHVKYADLLETLECMSPMHKDITDDNLHQVLPLAFDYQIEGLLHRCEIFLMDARLPFLEKLWLADRYKLNRLLTQCLWELRPHAKLDISGPRYYTLSDRVKVMVLEGLQGVPAPEQTPEPPVDEGQFCRPTDYKFAQIKGKSGRTFYMNPYYVAAWSNTVLERLSATNVNEFSCGATQDELKAFLFAIHPPQLRITEQNIAPILMAACKLESAGLVRRCVNVILSPTSKLSTFAQLSLLDRCFLHELLDTCLSALHTPEQAIEMALQGTYDCLSTKARAAILDRMSALLRKPGLLPHKCTRCNHKASCSTVHWVCPSCGGYCSAEHEKTPTKRTFTPVSKVLSLDAHRMLPGEPKNMYAVGVQGPSSYPNQSVLANLDSEARLRETHRHQSEANLYTARGATQKTGGGYDTRPGYGRMTDGVGMKTSSPKSLMSKSYAAGTSTANIYDKNQRMY